MNIKRVESTRSYVRITLENDVVVDLSSVDGHVHVSFSGIGMDRPVAVQNQYANGLEIVYPDPE